ncbi:MAG: M23 family metallopeptidase [Spirochaetes bacterium]|nr:M23 family metallopeptidase [Spirochaetota bacterium]
MKARVAAIAAIALALSGTAAEPAHDVYPPIARLDSSDLLYRQLSDLVAQSLAARQTGGQYPDLVIFSYKMPEDAEIVDIAARLNCPYETIVTLNRIGSVRPLRKGEVLLLPSVIGVYLPDEPSGDLEYLMDSWRRPEAASGIPLTAVVGGKSVRFRLFPGSYFHPAERAFFLSALFRFPLPKGRMTSGFGVRPSPVDGQSQMHQGIDLAAPAGTEVCAARSGTVSYVGFSDLLGNHVVISHEGGWETVYGHLSSVSVRLKENVKSGMMIGKVGSTGVSTGPHLHFEVRLKGAPRDPATVLPRMRP